MNTKKEIWCRAGDVSQNYQFMGQISKVFSNVWFKRALTDKISKFFINFKDGVCSIYFLKSEIKHNSKTLTDKVIKNPAWGVKLLDKTEKKHQEYFDYTESLRDINYPKQSGKKLIKLLKDAQLLNLIGHEVTRSFSWQLDKDNRRLNKYIVNMIAKQVKARNKNFKAKIIMPELTTPLQDTFIYEEQVDLLNIAVKIVKDNQIKDQFVKFSDGKRIIEEIMKKNDKIYKAIYSHYKNYRWLSYLYQEPAYKLDYYMNRLKDLVLDESSIGRLLSRYKNGKKKTQDVRKILIKEIKFSKEQLQLIEFARRLSFLKEFRKAVIAHGTFCLEKVYNELSKKYNVSLEQIRMLDYYELKKAVEGNYFDKGKLSKRIEAATFYYERKKQKRILEGQDSKDFIDKIIIHEKDDHKHDIFEGTIASTGKTKSTVKIINNFEDIEKMEEGDIIVTRITATNLGPTVEKAAGIISECGGLTCHAAILSRELDIPCLVGVDDATKKLKDGDEVELDAVEGVVKVI